MFSVLKISKAFAEDSSADLLSEDIAVSTVATSTEAREGLDAGNDFDCIVYDGGNNEDGLALLRNLRSTGNTTPFILLTKENDEVTVRNALKLGAQSVLPSNETSTEAVKLQLEKIKAIRSPAEAVKKNMAAVSDQLGGMSRRVAQLERKEREYDRLLTLMTSEFREQINTIDEFSRMLCEDLNEISRDDLSRYLELIHRSSSRIKMTIDTLQNYQRAQISELQLRNVNLSVIASSIMEDLAAARPGRQSRTCVASDLKALADESLIHLCFEYLLRTVWDSTLRKSYTELTFGCYRTSEETVYYLSNNGEPLSAEDQRKAFTAFEEMKLKLINDPGAIARDQHELNLAIVERIISRHGGRLWFEQSDAGNTTYLFTLSE